MYGRPIISPPTELLAEFSLNISSFSTCYDHTIAITKDGNMYAIGNNLNGQILPSLKKKKFKFRKINKLKIGTFCQISHY